MLRRRLHRQPDTRLGLVLLGLAWPWVRRWPLFHLPGDIVVDRPGFRFFFPLTTMLLLSALLTLVSWILRK